MTTPQTTRNPLVPIRIVLEYFVESLLGTSHHGRIAVAGGYAVVGIAFLALLLGATLLTTLSIDAMTTLAQSPK